MYKLLDVFFTAFHALVILFNLFGWIWKPTRKWNLVLLLLTGASWFILGIFYGIGYCPLTDWHWQVLDKLGVSGVPNSYVSFLLTRLTGIRLADTTVDVITVSSYLIALLLSVSLNTRDLIRWRKNKRED